MHRILYNIYIFYKKYIIIHCLCLCIPISFLASTCPISATESRGMDAKHSHTSEPLVLLTDDPSFSFCGLKGGGVVEYVEHTKISGMEFWKEFCFPKLRRAYFFQRNWGQVCFSRVLSSPSWAILQVVYRHLGRELDRDSPIQNRKPCSKEMVITRKERTHSRRCAPYQLYIDLFRPLWMG